MQDIDKQSLSQITAGVIYKTKDPHQTKVETYRKTIIVKKFTKVPKTNKNMIYVARNRVPILKSKMSL